MRWVLSLVILLLVLAAPLVSAASIYCPTSVEAGQTFTLYYSADAPHMTYRAWIHNSLWQQQFYASPGYTFPGWSITETTPTWYTYYVEYKDDNGNWVSCNRASSCTCQVEVVPAVDHPGSITLTATPNPVEYGQSVTLSVTYYDPDGTHDIIVKRGTDIIGQKNTCSGTTCTFTLTDTPQSSTSYKATGRDVNINPTDKTLSVTVNGAAPVVTYYTAEPHTITTGETITFQAEASDADSNLQSLKVDFGDGQHATQACSGGSCSFSTTHAYGVSGSFSTLATATDSEGHSGVSTTVPVYVTAPTDGDGDGVPDGADECAGTPPSEPVVTTGSYTGCSCNQIVNFDPDPTRDANACTDDTCSIVNGAFHAVHTAVPDGSQPEGLSDGCQGPDYVDYYCQSHAVANTTTPSDPQCTGCDSE